MMRDDHASPMGPVGQVTVASSSVLCGHDLHPRCGLPHCVSQTWTSPFCVIIANPVGVSVGRI